MVHGVLQRERASAHREEARDADLSETAQTINPQGVTIVPLVVRREADGSLFIRALNPDYRNPGPDEVQSFEPAPPAGNV